MSRFSWLGGSADPKADAQSVQRARGHRRSIPKAERAARKWDRHDHRLHGE
jgi:hypothetical protein